MNILFVLFLVLWAVMIFAYRHRETIIGGVQARDSVSKLITIKDLEVQIKDLKRPENAPVDMQKLFSLQEEVNKLKEEIICELEDTEATAPAEEPKLESDHSDTATDDNQQNVVSLSSARVKKQA